MVEGHQRAERQLNAALASLVWNDGTLDIGEYIKTGTFKGPPTAMPHDAALRAEIVRQFTGG